MSREEKRAAIITLSLAGVVLLMLLAPRVAQDPKYHNFAADHDLLGVSNFWNVLSNVPFLIVAWLGWRAIPALERFHSPQRAAYLIGVFLTGLGSAYYHWSPSTPTLFWDRLPMTIAFSAVTAGLVSQRIHKDWGEKLLWPLMIAGILSVIYWRWSENAGKGNLIPYAIVQFGTTLLVLVVLLVFSRRGPEQRNLWLGLAMYFLAKVLEAFDKPIADILNFAGGHPFKHAAAALGCWFIFRALFSPATQQSVASRQAAVKMAPPQHSR